MGEVIIIADDNSPDRTWEVARQLKNAYDLELLCRVDKNGIQPAEGNIIGVMDADLSHPP